MNSVEYLNKQYETKKSSGWVKIFISLAFLVIAIPLLIWGITQACYNGVTYMMPYQRNTRKVKKLKIKKEKEEVKKQLVELRSEVE